MAAIAVCEYKGLDKNKVIKSLKEFKDIMNKELLYMLIDRINIGKDFIYGETVRTHYKVTVNIVFAINDYCLEEFMKMYNEHK